MLPAKKRNLKKEKGFTLVELMIVVAIIGILAAIAIPQFAAYRTRTYNANAKAVVHNLMGSQSDLNAELGAFGWTEATARNLTQAPVAAGVADTNATTALAIGATATTAGARLAGNNSATGKSFAVPISLGVKMVASAVASGTGASYVNHARAINGDTAYAIDSDVANTTYSVSNPTWTGTAGLQATPVSATDNANNLANAAGGGAPTANWTRVE